MEKRDAARGDDEVNNKIAKNKLNRKRGEKAKQESLKLNESLDYERDEVVELWQEAQNAAFYVVSAVEQWDAEEESENSGRVIDEIYAQGEDCKYWEYMIDVANSHSDMFQEQELDSLVSVMEEWKELLQTDYMYNTEPVRESAEKESEESMNEGVQESLTEGMQHSDSLIEAVAEVYGCDLTQAEMMLDDGVVFYIENVQDLTDLGYAFVEECGGFDSMDEDVINRYVDWDALDELGIADDVDALELEEVFDYDALGSDVAEDYEMSLVGGFAIANPDLEGVVYTR